MTAALREPWFLFCGDQAFAEQCLLEAFSKSENAAEQAWLLKLLSRLGSWWALEHLLHCHDHLLQHSNARIALLHLRQNQGHPNPWLSLLPDSEKGPFLDRWQAWLESEQPLQVALSGGLGDQLESLAMLAVPPWNQRLELMLPETSRVPLQSLLEEASATAALPRWRFGNSSTDRPWLSWMALQAVFANAGVRLIPKVILGSTSRPEAWMVVCWRSKSEAGERLWGHLRSLSFLEIRRIYSWFLPWAAQRGFRIADITHYTTSEQQALLQQPEAHQRLSLSAPELRNLAETATLARRAAWVITVDTALAHLAHSLDIPRWLLLHRHPDQRWRRRLEQDGSSDQRSLRVLQQTIPQQWNEPLAQLRAALEG